MNGEGGGEGTKRHIWPRWCRIICVYMSICNDITYIYIYMCIYLNIIYIYIHTLFF